MKEIIFLNTWYTDSLLFCFVFVSLIMPPKFQISQMSKKLVEEFGTAANIKSRVNRLSVLAAITSAQQKLKLYSKSKFRLLHSLRRMD